jgi:hypothetical protein
VAGHFHWDLDGGTLLMTARVRGIAAGHQYLRSSGCHWVIVTGE